MISSESRMREIRTSGLMSGGEETWLRPRLRHRHRAKAAGNSYSLVPTAGRASPRLYKLSFRLPGRAGRGSGGCVTTFPAGLTVVSRSPTTLRHRSAIVSGPGLRIVRNQDWLYTISTEDFGFFGIVLEAWRIGESLPAPRLRVEVKPDNWSRSVQAARSSGLTDTQQAYLRFWGEFQPAFRDAYPDWTRSNVPRKEHWMIFPSARSALLKYSAAFCRTAGGYGLRAEAYIDTGDRETTKEAFDGLREKQGQIEQTVGDELDWDRLDDKRASRISLYFPDRVRVTDEERWPEARTWLVQAMGKMRDAFDPILKELQA